MTTIPRRGPNVIFSWFRFLTTKQYTVGVTTGKLTDHFAGLKIRTGYPDDLEKITVPTLAICGPERSYGGQEFFGTSTQEDFYPLSIHGFVVGQGDDAANRVYRDKLRNDVYQLAVAVMDEGFTLYDAQTKAAIGELETEGVSEHLVPANAPEVEAERYKFVVEATIPYV